VNVTICDYLLQRSNKSAYIIEIMTAQSVCLCLYVCVPTKAQKQRMAPPDVPNIRLHKNAHEAHMLHDFAQMRDCQKRPKNYTTDRSLGR